MNSRKNKGDKAEREAAEILTEVTGFEVRRQLGAGRFDDVGDLDGIPHTVIQCANWENKSRACLVKPREVEMQRWHAKAKFATSMLRWRVSKNDEPHGHWRMVMTVAQWWKITKAALWAVQHGYKG